MKNFRLWISKEFPLLSLPMVRLKQILTLVLCLSIAIAGFPVMAMPSQCPMEKMQQTAMKMAAKMEHCDKCPEMAKQKPEKKKNGGCCDDAACNMKCMGIGSLAFHAPDYVLPVVPVASPIYAIVDTALGSGPLNSQDRPPKSLS